MLFTAKETYTEQGLDKQLAGTLAACDDSEIYELFALSNRVRNIHRGTKVDLCSIINAKSGACPEDCSFCAQSAHSNTGVKKYPLLNKPEILKAAMHIKEKGAKRFCIVTSGKKPSQRELEHICDYISEIKELGLLPCATLGMLDKTELQQLKDSGLHRYHHNLETSESFFREICRTHTYKEKIRTIEAAQSIGLSVCSGGIFGLGESWEDRIDMAFALKDLGVDSIPINFFSPINGTPLSSRELLSPLDALKIIAICRLILPEREIRVCGGRPSTLRDLNPLIFMAGADGLLLGNYLTTSGRNPDDDLLMIQDLGFTI